MMPKTNNPPTGGKPAKRSGPKWMFAVIGVVVLLSLGAGAWTMHSAADPGAATTNGQRVTLDPARFFGTAREAYEVAEKDPALLVQLHCYCGCDKEIGHRNLLDCYRDDHGGHCPVCTGEALEAAKLADEGLPIDQIRRVLRDHYAQGN